MWRDRIFLYQAWRNPRAKVGAALYPPSRSKVRTIDVQRGQPASAARRSPVTIGGAGEVPGAVEPARPGARCSGRRPHAFGEPRYWLTFWLTDGTTLERAYFVETRELMGGVVLTRGVQRAPSSVTSPTERPSAQSRSATASPGREAWGVWGAMSWPPTSLEALAHDVLLVVGVGSHLGLPAADVGGVVPLRGHRQVGPLDLVGGE